MVEVSLTVGKLDASLALLLTKDHHLIEFPTILLPNGVKAGSIVKIKCDQDLETEIEEARQFQSIQDEILSTFGKNLPQSPNLKIKNVTQTSCILEWDKLELGTSSLKNLILFKDGKKLGSIPQPLTNRTTKLSGLPIDKSFKFQLRLDTTAGIYSSNQIEVTTHKMTDLSGITVCLGDFSANDQFSKADIEDALKKMGANFPPQDKIKVDTTHFICTRENKQNPEFLKASDMNIPIIRPEWLKACERERRIVGVRDFYIKDCVLPDIFSKNYWGDSTSTWKPVEKSAEQPVESSIPESQDERPSDTGPSRPEATPLETPQLPASDSAPETNKNDVGESTKEEHELPPLPQSEQALEEIEISNSTEKTETGVPQLKVEEAKEPEEVANLENKDDTVKEESKAESVEESQVNEGEIIEPEKPIAEGSPVEEFKSEVVKIEEPITVPEIDEPAIEAPKTKESTTEDSKTEDSKIEEPKNEETEEFQTEEPQIESVHDAKFNDTVKDLNEADSTKISERTEIQEEPAEENIHETVNFADTGAVVEEEEEDEVPAVNEDDNEETEEEEGADGKDEEGTPTPNGQTSPKKKKNKKNKRKGKK